MASEEVRKMAGRQTTLKQTGRNSRADAAVRRSIWSSNESTCKFHFHNVYLSSLPLKLVLKEQHWEDGQYFHTGWACRKQTAFSFICVSAPRIGGFRPVAETGGLPVNAVTVTVTSVFCGFASCVLLTRLGSGGVRPFSTSVSRCSYTCSLNCVSVKCRHRHRTKYGWMKGLPQIFKPKLSQFKHKHHV